MMQLQQYNSNYKYKYVIYTRGLFYSFTFVTIILCSAAPEGIYSIFF